MTRSGFGPSGACWSLTLNFPPLGVVVFALLSSLAIVAIWLGYPLAVWGLAQLFARARQNTHRSANPTVSVLIASREDPVTFLARADDVLAGDYGQIQQVIVALDFATYSVLPALPTDVDSRIVVIQGDSPGGKACSLNAAARVASGDVLVFTDVAQRFAPNTVGELVRGLEENPSMGAISGLLEVGTDGGDSATGVSAAYWRLERWLRQQEARLHSAVGVTGAVYAMRRSLWSPFPPGTILDDLYRPMRLVLDGHRVGFTPSAAAYDVRRFAPVQESRRKVRTLTGIFQLCAWLPGVLSPVRNPIWMQFVMHKLMRLLTPYLLVAAALSWGIVIWRLLVPVVGVAVLVGAGVAAAVVAIAVPRLRGMLRMGLAMQGAIVRATINGIRGDWDVWR